MPKTHYTTLSQIAATYWPILVVSFVVSLLLTPLCRRLALAYNIVDHPDAHLKTHKQPTPYCGGVAIFGGWLAGIIVALLAFRDAADPNRPLGGDPSLYVTTMIGILLAGAGITLLGLVDDVFRISPRVKLLCNILIALLVLAFGVGDELVQVFAGSVRARFEPDEQWLIYAYSWPLTIFIIVGACNATNLMDGLDGLCSGVLGIISLGFLILAVHMHLYSNWGPSEVQRVVLSLALLGSAFGFLPFNRNPARIFMGDAGSMLLGLNAAILVLLFAEEYRVQWMMGSVMVFGLPVADMVLTLVRRWRAQRPLMIGDRSHFYDQLIDRGLSVRQVVRISYALAALFVLMGVLPTTLRTRYLVLVYFAVFVLLAYAVHRFKMVRVDPPRPPPIRDES